MEEMTIENLFNHLGKILKPEDVYVWLMTPNAAFNNRKPICLLDTDEDVLLWQMVWEIISGVAQ